MDPIKIQRINALAKKSKEEGLNEEEREEQKKLREEYIESYRRGTKHTLDSLVIVGPDGKRRKLKKK